MSMELHIHTGIIPPGFQSTSTASSYTTRRISHLSTLQCHIRHLRSLLYQILSGTPIFSQIQTLLISSHISPPPHITSPVAHTPSLFLHGNSTTASYCMIQH